MTNISRAFTTTDFLYGAQADYVDALYTRYLSRDASLPESWKAFFQAFDPNREGNIEAPLLRSPQVQSSPAPSDTGPAPAYQKTVPGAVTTETLDSIRALMLIRAYRVRGHLYAKLDPLGLDRRTKHPELEPEQYGFGPTDLDRPIFIDNLLGRNTATMGEILGLLQEIYCGSIGVEFMHIQDGPQKSWIQENFENLQNRRAMAAGSRQRIFEGLMHAEMFEKFLNIKYPGAKRFGLDGGESFIPCVTEVLARSAGLGVQECVLGMAHRGRLNVLANIMEKPIQAILHEFQGNSPNPEDVQGDGDVKYHLGASADRTFEGHPMHLSLTPNPSHLEAVDPVVLGKVRAKQALLGDEDRHKVMGILVHGDAAFAGQGMVAECLDLSELQGYKTGGTIQIIINNQIGFTTKPVDSRSSPYCSDLAKAIQAPILHVNGDDPEAVHFVAQMAAEFRNKFQKNIIIDLYCYRRHGHNEGDEPMFTQPRMYKSISKHQTTFALYRDQLIKEGIFTAQQAKDLEDAYKNYLNACFEESADFKAQNADWLSGKWQGISAYGQNAHNESQWTSSTGLPLKTLKELGKGLTTLPPDFHPHSKIKRFLQTRATAIESGKGIDWSTAEALAFGSLLVEGNPVRLSGQDCGRGTFSQRHAELHDQENNTVYVPLQHLAPKQAAFDVINSPLAEASVLGFEYGYSSVDPNTLVLWEAQFGDFANGAQVIIDQFLAAGESKWLRMNGLVMLLPHGYEGQGPEHSSARIERYLQLCAEDNMQVVNCTTPANYFHVLRRQLRRDFRKPLIIFTPKSLLRHKRCVSDLASFSTETRFDRVIGETNSNFDPKAVDRVVICSGKVYYDLLKAREASDLKTTAILRLEQYYPFPLDSLEKELEKYGPNARVVWCQEEPSNMGAWWFVERRLESTLTRLNYTDARPYYVGRKEAASTATGLMKRHISEQEMLVRHALDGQLNKHHAAINV